MFDYYYYYYYYYYYCCYSEEIKQKRINMFMFNY